MPEAVATLPIEPTPTLMPDPTCAHCGSVIHLATIDRDCCHALTTDIQRMQLDSTRQVGRYVLHLLARIGQLTDRLDELEARPRGRKG